MRQIKIQKVIYPGKTHYIKFNMYAVYLGNDSKNYFSNLKDAKQFVVATNHFLNLKLQEFNQVYIGILSAYQRNWFYFSSKNIEANRGLNDLEQKITDNIQAITKAMNFMVTRSGSANGNYYVFSYFNNCIQYSTEIIDNLLIVLKERKHYIEIRNLEILKNYLEKIHKDIIGYGKYEKSGEKPTELEFI